MSLKIIKIVYLITRQYYIYNKDLKVNHQSLYTEEIDKIALSRNDDKRIQTFDKIATYPYGKMFLKYVKMRC